MKIIWWGTLAVISISIFMLFACDEEKNDNIMQILAFSVLTGPPVSRLVLYNAGTTPSGNLGGRSGADGLCSGSINKPTGASNIHAFISVSDSDEIRDMPGNYGYSTDLPIYNRSGSVRIVDTWADLLDGSIDISLSSAIVVSSEWWSGSLVDGSLTVNCGSFTSNSTDTSQLGSSSDTDWRWLQGFSTNCSDSNIALLCIGSIND